MAEIWTMGEMLVEIMRPRADMSLREPGEFLGPFPSGAPAIFIDMAARLGHGAGIIGGVGDDDFGRCLLDRLRRDGVDCQFVSVLKGPATGVAFVTYRSDGSRQFIYHIGNTPAGMAVAPDLREVAAPAFFHVMGCSLLASDALRAEILKALEAFAARGAKISFDPNLRVELLGPRGLEEVVKPVLSRSSVLEPGVDELLMLSGEPTIEKAAARLFQNPRLEVIALKRGAKGCTVFTRQRSFSLGVYAVAPLDPTGAGDAFDAGFLCGLLEKRPLEDCAKVATAAAALNTAAFGPMEGDVSPRTVAALMQRPLV
ncbi:MAG TPA: sugar kinase [Anaeromyxobacter sp.]|nr:sugar kinase [Anaeromyxobacter sp.]